MVAIAVASAPVALQWCRASCAAEGLPSAAGGASHHSCHDLDGGTSRRAVTPQPHICGHGAAVPTTSARDANVVVNTLVAVVGHATGMSHAWRSSDAFQYRVPITRVHEPPSLIPLRI